MTDALVARGLELNRAWLSTDDGAASFLAGYAARYNDDEYVGTSCEITAMALRAHFAPGVPTADWRLLDEGVAPGADERVLQVQFGDDWTCTEHIVTIVGDTLYDSWFRRYRLRAIACDRAAMAAHPAEYLLSLLDSPPGLAGMELFYWVPPTRQPTG